MWEDLGIWDRWLHEGHYLDPIKKQQIGFYTLQ